MTRAGTTRYASAILILKPRPTRTALSSNQRNLPVSAAWMTAHAASKSTSARVASMVLLRLVTTLIGLMARSRAARLLQAQCGSRNAGRLARAAAVSYARLFLTGAHQLYLP